LCGIASEASYPLVKYTSNSNPDSDRQENSVKFRNVDTGKYLDSSAKGEVYAFDGNGGNNQRWIIEKADKGINLRNQPSIRFK
jgi:hypothetical protein